MSLTDEVEKPAMKEIWITFMRDHGYQCELCWRNIKLGERFTINKSLIANSPHYAFDHIEPKDCTYLASEERRSQ